MLSDELTIHYGLLPRANRGIFAINELPDLAGKVQVGLFNIMQEGDVQIKGYPVRLPLDVLLCFTANPEDYTARGKIITPLKDRIGSEIMTHYPETRRARDGDHAAGSVDRARRRRRCASPTSSPKSIERIAFEARDDKRIDKRSGVSQRMPITVHRERRLERRAARDRDSATRRSCRASPTSTRRCPRSPARSSWSTRVSWSAAPAIARELIRRAADATFQERAGGVEHRRHRHVVRRGRRAAGDRRRDARTLVSRASRRCRDWCDLVHTSGSRADDDAAKAVAACELVLEALVARKKISRSDGGQYGRADAGAAPAAEQDLFGGGLGLDHDRQSSGERASSATHTDAVPRVGRPRARSRRGGRAADRAAPRVSGPSDLRTAASGRRRRARDRCSRRSSLAHETIFLAEPTGEVVGMLRCVEIDRIAAARAGALLLRLVRLRASRRSAAAACCARCIDRGRALVPQHAG